MRTLIPALLLLLASASTATAADTFTVPYSVVPGTVVYHPAVDPSYSISLPFSGGFDPLATSVCASSSSSFFLTEASGALQLDFDAFIAGIGTGGVSCDLQGAFTMEIEVVVPELGGTSTDVRLEVAVPIFNFPEYDRIVSTLTTEGDVSSSALGPDLPYAVRFENTSRWSDERPTVEDPIFESSPGVVLQPLIPGDTLRIPIRIEIFERGHWRNNDTIGDMRIRYELKVTVPELSASLGLPLGALGLAGLASLKGAT